MHKNMKLFNGLAMACAMTISAGAYADDYYEVTITNLTRGQSFTPVLVASHRGNVDLFELGSPASDELAALAEGGDIAPFTAVLDANRKVVDIADSGGLLDPGASVTVTVSADHGARRISLLSMMIPTNDAFIALSNVKAPRGHGSRSYRSPAYDAGTEPNDELCASIPGPVCGGNGGSPGVGGEGYVHIHAGIHGIGNLEASDYDWRNSVAKVSIRRIED